MIRSMLKGKYLPKTYWTEPVDCAVYLLNYYSTKSVKFRMPLKMCSNIKPRVNHLKVFGNIAYEHIPEQRERS